MARGAAADHTPAIAVECLFFGWSEPYMQKQIMGMKLIEPVDYVRRNLWYNFSQRVPPW